MYRLPRYFQTEMLIYLDSSVFGMAAELSEEHAISELLSKTGHIVVASEFNMAECLRIPEDSTRIALIRAVTAIATDISPTPVSMLQAEEFVNAVRRHRPGWLVSSPDTTRQSVLLNKHRRLFTSPKRNPRHRFPGLAKWANDFERGAETSRAAQKGNRELRRQGQSVDEDRYWRVKAMYTWTTALVNRPVGAGDYLAAAGPFVQSKYLAGPDYQSFWLDEVGQDEVPFNRCTGLADLYQTDHKVGHGNTMDALHANYLLLTDLFVTTDRALGRVLAKLRDAFPKSARVAEIERSSSSLVGSLSSFL